MKEYVLGLMFDEARKNVALVSKNRPAWQAEHFNGIGGKIEGDELPLTAMRREFAEETGVQFEDWQPFVRLYREGEYAVYVFVAYTDRVREVKTMTDERVVIWPATHLAYTRHIANLDWLVPMARDPHVAKGQFIDVEDVGGN